MVLHLRAAGEGEAGGEDGEGSATVAQDHLENTPDSVRRSWQGRERALRAALRHPNIRNNLNGASPRPAGATPLSFLARIFGTPRDRLALRPLYDAAVARARDPFWYREGGVPDTLEGRFDMLTAVLALLLLRLERDGEAAAGEAARLTEIFIEDMDGTMREIGFGDIVVGKEVGKLLGALGGRMGRFREALAGTGDEFEPAVAHNVYRDAPPSEASLGAVAGRLRDMSDRFGSTATDDLLAGRLP